MLLSFGKKKPYILGVNGSPHQDGVVLRLLEKVLEGARRAGAEVEIVNLYDLFIVHEQGRYSKNVSQNTESRWTCF